MKQEGLSRGTTLWISGAVLIAAIVRCALLPGKGFAPDIFAFETWTIALATNGPAELYANSRGLLRYAVDYPPGYMLALLAIGDTYTKLCHCSNSSLYLRMLLKLPAVLADFGIAAVAYLTSRHVTSVRNARTILIICLVAPPLWLISAYWGQVDSVACLGLLLTLWAAVRKRWIAMWAIFACTILIKPQALSIAPLLLIWEIRTDGLTPALPVGFIAAALIAYMCTLPFAADHRLFASAHWLANTYVVGLDKYPNNTSGGFTLFGITGNFYTSDGARILGIALHTWGLILFLSLLFAVSVRLWVTLPRSPEPTQLLTSSYVALCGFFVLNTRMHERYLLPALVIGAMVAFVNRGYGLTTVIFCCTFVINCAFTLVGFHGGTHHYQFTLPIAHFLSMVNVVAFSIAAGTLFFTRAQSKFTLPLARALPEALGIKRGSLGSR